jgi:hypothetical protein
MIYLKSALSGLLAVAFCGLIAFAVFVQNAWAVMFTGRDVLFFGILPVLTVFVAGFLWMLRRESKRFSK